MAIYKIFPEKSATLYSFYPTVNTGIDEILEVSTFTSYNGTNESSRALLQFSSAQIQDIIANKVSGNTYDAYLKLYLANGSNLPLNYTLHCYTISGSWNQGTGRLGNVPSTTDGVSWYYQDTISGSSWINGSFKSGTTGSYTSNTGGGVWYSTGSLEATQSFATSTSKDIEFKVTNTVKGWYNYLTNPFATVKIENDGFIIKHDSSVEFTTASKAELKYFSSNTHTIYPPCLEIRWDDSQYITGSLSVITSDLFVPSLGNNKGEYQQDSIQRFRVNVRDKFPPRVFQTSSIYLNNKALPSSSYWSIKDLDTEEIVVDYDTTYTKISCDTMGSYFDVYMSGLEPERYYKLLLKTVLSNGETVVNDNNYYFKVIR